MLNFHDSSLVIENNNKNLEILNLLFQYHTSSPRRFSSSSPMVRLMESSLSIPLASIVEILLDSSEGIKPFFSEIGSSLVVVTTGSCSVS